MNHYAIAKEQYAQVGVDTEQALERLANTPLSIHCWHGDDVMGFESAQALTGGIQVTGDSPGRARNPEELMADLDQALRLIPGVHRVNLHAIYAITDGETVGRDQLEYRHFAPWVEFAKERGMGIDFNPTLFSHPLSDSGYTLSSADESIRRFWIDHCKATRKLSAEIGKTLGTACLHNIWIADGAKEVPVDRLSPRRRLKESLDEIYSIEYNEDTLIDALESKLFGIGLEAYTVGSLEFYLGYAARSKALCLLDNGHYHPDEQIADKISSLLVYCDRLALHLTRHMHWDSDHVVRLSDEMRSIAHELVACGVLERTSLGLDFFDASFNRIAGWVIGARSVQKAILCALLTPHDRLKELEAQGDKTRVMVLEESLKGYPWGAVWDEFCRRQNVPEREEYMQDIDRYSAKAFAQRS